MLTFFIQLFQTFFILPRFLRFLTLFIFRGTFFHLWCKQGLIIAMTGSAVHYPQQGAQRNAAGI